MKKVVLKTASITLAAVIVAALIGYGVFALFFPYNLASFYRGAANYDLALKYSERGYLKSENHDLKDLLIVVYDAIDASNNEKIEKYAARALLSGDLTENERLRISQSYCLALYARNKKNGALEKAAELTLGGAICTGYVTGNPFRAVIGAAAQEVSDCLKSGKEVSAELTEYVKKISAALEKMQAEKDLSESETALLKGDMSMISELIARIGKTNENSEAQNSALGYKNTNKTVYI
ncbi:MAG: hypothetical protein SOX77_03365 [Candidatus Borkfalkiaceae bacterium]|nr:hypothetical protein [Christensenellaceae bacterium]